MSDSVRKIYVSSPVFTREDEECYQYVDTEVGGLTEEEEYGEFESLINGKHVPQVAAGYDRYEEVDQVKNHVRDSIVRDSLEDVSAPSNNETGIVVADPSRYEDLRTTDRHTDLNQARGNSRSDVMPKCGNSESKPRHYYLNNDDAEEYEETQLERQHQRQEARRAHVPHLELSHSDDEPCTNEEGTFDLEIDDGRSSHTVYKHHSSCQRNANHGNRCHVSFGALPLNSDSADSSQLADSLEVAQHHPSTGAVGGNPSYERSMYADHQAHDKNESHGSHNNIADSHLSFYRSIHRGDTGHYRNVPVEDKNYQSHTVVQNSSAKRQQLSSHSHSGKAQVPHHFSNSQCQGQTLQTFNARSNKPVENGSVATDFVEANRHGMNRKAQRTYGQIYSRKKGGIENMVNSDRSAAHRPADPASATGSKKENAAEASDEQNLHPTNRQCEESDVLNAEQLWHVRSQWLAVRKESAEKNGRSRDAARPMNRVTREVRVNDSRPVVSQVPSSVAHKHHSGVQHFAVGSFGVPEVHSEVSGGLPQKVSVDINLNVLSPRRSLNQPTTSLPQDAYQYSSRTQEVFSNASGQYHYPATFQPAAVVPQSTVSNPAQYTPATVFPAHPHSAPQFVSSGRQQLTPRWFDSRLTPNQAAVPQTFPVRYNYTYPQPLATPVSDVPLHLVQPYYIEVCSLVYPILQWL